MIKFVIRAKKNPLKRDQVKFYPQMAPGVPVDARYALLDELKETTITIQMKQRIQHLQNR